MQKDTPDSNNNPQPIDRTIALRNESQKFIPSFNMASEGLSRTTSGFTPYSRKTSMKFLGNRSSIEVLMKKPDTSLNLANFKKIGNKVRTSIVFAQAIKGGLKENDVKVEVLEEESQEKEKAEDEQNNLNVFLGTKRRNFKQVDIESLEQDELLELAISIFQKPSTYRSINDIKMLVKSTENVKFFQEVSKENGKETHEQCVRFMFHKYLKKDDVLFETGSIGTTFYVILKGRVGVWVKIPKETVITRADGTEEKKTELILTEVKIMNAGESFGELALLDNKPRAATIICKENSHFGVLDKQYFNRILKEKEVRKLAVQIEFVASMKVFSNWSYNAVKNVYYACNLREYKRGQIVFKEGDDVDGFYMIKSGEFKVQQTVEVERPKADENDYFLKTNSSFLNPRTLPFDVAMLLQGEIFGEEELVYPKKRTLTVSCFSTIGSAYFLNKKEFNRRVLYEENSRKFLKSLIERKTEWRNKRMEDFKLKTSKALIFPAKQRKLNDLLSTAEDGVRKYQDLHNPENLKGTKNHSHHDSTINAANLSFQYNMNSTAINLLEELNLDGNTQENSKDASYDHVITNKKESSSPIRKEKKVEPKGLLSMYLNDKTLRDAMNENKKEMFKMKRQLGKALVDEFAYKDLNLSNDERSLHAPSRKGNSNLADTHNQSLIQENDNSRVSLKSSGSGSSFPLMTKTIMLQDKIKHKLGERYMACTIRSRVKDSDEGSVLKRNLSSEEHMKLNAYIKHEEIRALHLKEAIDRRKKLGNLPEHTLTMKMKLKLREFKKSSGEGSDKKSPSSHDISHLKASNRSREILKPLGNRQKPISLDFDQLLESHKNELNHSKQENSTLRLTFSGTQNMHKEVPLERNRMLKPIVDLLPLKYKVGMVTDPKISITSPFRPKAKSLKRPQDSTAPRQSTSFF